MTERFIDLTITVAFLLSAAVILSGATSFEDRWLARVKPQPYDGIATTFSDRKGAWGNRLDHSRSICAHHLEKRGQLLLVTNRKNGRQIVCEVQDRGPNRRFWPRREIDLSPTANKALGCSGMCDVDIERVSR